jgi:hypothetical protein
LTFSVGLDYVSVASDLLPVVAGIITYRKHSFILRVLLFFLILAALNDGASVYLSRMNQSCTVIGNFYSLLELLVYSVLFLSIIFKQQKTVLLLVTGVIFCLYFVVTSVYSGGFQQVNTIFNVSECVLVLVIAGLLLLKISSDTDFVLYKNPLFWIGVGMTIYFSLSLLTFVIVDIEIKNKTTILVSLWGIHSVVNIIANSMYGIAFLCRLPKKLSL